MGTHWVLCHEEEEMVKTFWRVQVDKIHGQNDFREVHLPETVKLTRIN